MIRTLAFSFAALTIATAAAEPSVTERYFDGLRQRGLFDLAESEALRRLAADPSIDDRAILVTELARTFVEHAKYLEGAEQAELGDRAIATVEAFLADHPQYPGKIRQEVLIGELATARGETRRWLAELLPNQPDHRGQAERHLTAAIERLTQAERSLDRRFRDRSRARTTERSEPLTAGELASLLTRTRLLLGTAELELARLAETRSEHLEAAERWLEIVAKGPAVEESTWRAQIALAETARLVGQPDLARRRLLALDTAALPDAAKDAIAAISVKLWLDEGKPDQAATFLIDYRRTRGSLTGELRLLQVLGLAQAAAVVETLGKQPEADALREQIPTVVRWAEAEQGGYWAYRVRLAARQAERSGLYGVDVAEQVRRAETAIASGNTDGAVAAYVEAERLAADDPAIAVQFAYARASVLLKAERFEEAAAAFASVLTIDPKAEKAAEAHLLSAYALGRTNEREPSAERRDAYVARLEEHRDRFPGSPTAADATSRLARFLEQRRQYSKSLPLLLELVDDPARGPAARAAVARNYENLLLHLQAASKTAATPAEAAAREAQIVEWSATAVGDLTELTEPLRSDTARTEPLSAQEAEFALRSVQILTRHGGDSVASNRLLDLLAVAMTAERPEAERPFWQAVRQSVPPLRVVSLAGQDRYAEAAELIDSLRDVPAGDLLEVIRRLTELAESEADKQNARFSDPRLGKLRQAAVELLMQRRQELSPGEAGRFDAVLAKADLADGNASMAIDHYESALAERPNDKALLTQAATVLLDSGEPEAVRRARTYWRRLEDREKKGSEPWLRARLKVAESSLVLGDLAEARKVLTVTKLLHPQLGGPEIKAAYETALRELDKATKKNESR